jgi:2-polyprenyl-6-hydroxyphenyl methylase/3-demethylubiquinone-9 3-methyltransferase
MDPASTPGTPQRFAFGKNWRRFLEHVDEERIAVAEESLERLLRQQDLTGSTFLDVGCGSGLFSLAARRLGAQRVHSFDFDPQSVACARELRRRFEAAPSPKDETWEEGTGEKLSGWTIERGDVLDAEFRDRLPVADVVYSWGVLHHTGHMWRALEAAAELVAPDGLLCIAIYNHQPFLTGYWKVVKRLYNRLPGPLAWCLSGAYYLFSSSVLLVADLLRGRAPLARHRSAGPRGMNHYHDVVDWIGGWPFEAAKPEEIFRFYRDRGFTLQELTTCGGRHGCNEFLFRRQGS